MLAVAAFESLHSAGGFVKVRLFIWNTEYY